MDNRKKTSLRICIILPLFYPFKSGGIERLYTQIGKIFQQSAGASILIITRRLRKPEIIVYPNDFEIFPVSTPSQTRIGKFFLLIYFSFIENIVFAWKAARAARDLAGRFDIIISSDVLTTNFLRRYKREIQCPIVQTSHGFLADVIGLSQPLIKPIYAYLEKRGWASCDFALFLGKIHARRYANVNVPHKILNAPTDLTEFTPHRYNKNELRSKYGFNEKFVVITVASLRRKVKGLEFLIPAIKKIRNEIPNVYLVIAGKGDPAYYIDIAKTYGVENSINFLGERNDIPQLLKAADIFILPSLSEGIPQAIVEALAMEKPVIASEVGGIPDIIVDGRNGVLISPASVLAITAAVVRLNRNVEEARKLGKRGNLDVIENNSLEKISHKFYSILEELIKVSGNIEKLS